MIQRVQHLSGNESRKFLQFLKAPRSQNGSFGFHVGPHLVVKESKRL